MENLKSIIYNFNPNVIKILIVISAILIMMSIAFWIFDMLKQEERENNVGALVSKTKQNMLEAMNESKNKWFSYRELDLYLKRTGVDYMSKGKLTPLTYILLRIILSVLGFFVGLSIDIPTAIGIFIATLILPQYIIKISNNTDILAMLKDLKSIYDLLRIQGKAGVFITDSLADAYLVVENRRLRTACLRLSNDISARVDLNIALDNFKNKFENEYINSLVVILKQSLESGRSVKMLDDMREQLSDIEAMIIMLEKQKIKRYITISQVLIYGVIIAISILVALLQVSDSMNLGG